MPIKFFSKCILKKIIRKRSLALQVDFEISSYKQNEINFNFAAEIQLLELNLLALFETF